MNSPFKRIGITALPGVGLALALAANVMESQMAAAGLTPSATVRYAAPRRRLRRRQPVLCHDPGRSGRRSRGR